MATLPRNNFELHDCLDPDVCGTDWIATGLSLWAGNKSALIGSLSGALTMRRFGRVMYFAICVIAMCILSMFREISVAVGRPASKPKVAASKNPDAILHRIAKEGAPAVLRDLYQDEKTWDGVLGSVSTGSRKWLDVATRLREVSDAGSSDALELALGDALEKSPGDVLALCSGRCDISGVCGNIGHYKDILAHVERRKRLVKSIAGSNLLEKRDKCLKSLGVLEAEVKASVLVPRSESN